MRNKITIFFIKENNNNEWEQISKSIMKSIPFTMAISIKGYTGISRTKHF